MKATEMYQRHYDDEPDWQQSEDDLFDESCETIRGFALEHPECVCSFFAFDCDAVYGDVNINLDSAQNGFAEGQKYQDESIKWRTEKLVDADSWRWAQAYFALSMVEHSISVSEFEFSCYGRRQFREWETFAFSSCYPKRERDDDPGYLTGHVTLILWRVLERLHDARIFEQLNLASPFRLGYEYHDDARGLVVTRIMNWTQFESR